MGSSLHAPVENVYGIGGELGKVLRENGVSTLGKLAREYQCRGLEGFKRWVLEERLGIEGRQLGRVCNALEAYCKKNNLPLLPGALLSPATPKKQYPATVPKDYSMLLSPQHPAIDSDCSTLKVSSSSPRYAKHVRVTKFKHSPKPKGQHVTRVVHSRQKLVFSPCQRRHLSQTAEDTDDESDSHLGQVHTDVLITYFFDQ